MNHHRTHQQQQPAWSSVSHVGHIRKHKIMTDTNSKPSQVAKAKPWYDVPPILPSIAKLGENGGVSAEIKSAKRKNELGQRVGRQAMYHALTRCVHVAYFLLLEPGTWEKFCKDTGRSRGNKKPAEVLYEVFLEYADRDGPGQKTASRYKRALVKLFEQKMPALEIYKRLCLEGADGLLNDKSNDEVAVVNKKKLNAVNISESGIYAVTLPKGYRQTVTFHAKSSASFELKVTKKMGPFGKPIGLKKK